MELQPGKIIFVNGTSSAGKSTLCRALTDILPLPFWHFSSDKLIESGMRADGRIAIDDFNWADMRPAFFEGFHRMIPAFASAGNHLLVEHIVEEDYWGQALMKSLKSFDVFIVSVRCAPDIFIAREKKRQDTYNGEALYHMKTYGFITHHLEVNGADDANENAHRVLQAWQNREHLKSDAQ